MECITCKEQIDDDSSFCDLCGTGVARCPACKAPVAGSFCTACGSPAKSAVSSTADPAAISATPPLSGSQRPPFASTPSAIDAAGGTRRLSDPDNGSRPVGTLRLRNLTLGIDVTMADGTIVGRAAGPHIGVFSRFDQVSSRHCRFHLDPSLGWCVTDLGSTNLTRYNNDVLSPNAPRALKDSSFLKLANIEFLVTIGTG